MSWKINEVYGAKLMSRTARGGEEAKVDGLLAGADGGYCVFRMPTEAKLTEKTTLRSPSMPEN